MEVIRRVSDLLHGHPALIQGFNIFLPDGYHMDMVDHADNQATTPTVPDRRPHKRQKRASNAVNNRL